MKITVTGASGLIGSKLVERLRARGDEVATLSRNPSSPGAVRWLPEQEPAPGRRAQRQRRRHPPRGRERRPALERRRQAPHPRSRELGTRNLVAGIEAADPRPRVLVSASAVGYYGPHGDEEVDEDTPPGDDFLAEVCVDLGARGAARGRARPARRQRPHRRHARQGRRRAGQDAPVLQARRRRPGRRRRPVHAVDPRRRRGRHLPRRTRRRRLGGPGQRQRPDAGDQQDVLEALGRALHRPAFAPVPGLAIHALYGEMAEIVTKGQRVIPRRAQEHGYAFAHPDLDEALRAAL